MTPLLSTSGPLCVVGAALLALAAACGDSAGDELPTAEAIDACETWHEASCERFAACLGEDQAWIDACVAPALDPATGCEAQVQAAACPNRAADDLTACAAALPGSDCAALCDDKACFAPCVYDCRGARGRAGGVTWVAR